MCVCGSACACRQIQREKTCNLSIYGVMLLVKMKCQKSFTQKIDFSGFNSCRVQKVDFMSLGNRGQSQSTNGYLHITEIISVFQIGEQSQKTEITSLRSFINRAYL